MRLHHALIRPATLLAAMGLTVAVISFVGWYQIRPIDLATAPPEDLFRWLVTHDLKNESLETRELFARRLDDAFDYDLDWEAIRTQLTDRHRALLWSNVPLILEPWFMDKVERYHALEPARRLAHVDATIDMMLTWQGLDKLAPEADQPEGSKAAGGFKQMLNQNLIDWRSRAEPQQQKKIDEFLLAVELRWTLRKWTGKLNSPKAK